MEVQASERGRWQRGQAGVGRVGGAGARGAGTCGEQIAGVHRHATYPQLLLSLPLAPCYCFSPLNGKGN